MVGTLLGTRLGTPVLFWCGENVGASDGTIVGTALGVSDGASVGFAVGISVRACGPRAAPRSLPHAQAGAESSEHLLNQLKAKNQTLPFCTSNLATVVVFADVYSFSSGGTPFERAYSESTYGTVDGTPPAIMLKTTLPLSVTSEGDLG